MGRSQGRALLAFREQKSVGGHHGRAGDKESKGVGEEYSLVQEGFLEEEVIELPTENRQGSGPHEGIGL